MKIAVDLNCLSEEWAGFQYYTTNFLRSLSLAFDGDLELLHYGDARDLPPVRSTNHRYRKIETWIRSRVVREQIVTPWQVSFDPDIDRLLIPAYLGPISCPVEIDLLVFDLLFLRDDSGLSYKQRCYWEGLYERAFRNASRLFPCSRSTGRQIVRKFPELQSKVGPPLYPGVRQFQSKESTSVVPRFDNPFLLFVGTVSPRKNLTSLIECFLSARDSTFKGYDLRIVGRHGWGQPDEDTLKNYGEGIHWHGDVSDEVLSKLYNEAELFCLPSRGEGFGMPILEAFANRTPVVVSDIEVFREVADSAGFYIDLDHPSDWYRTFDRALNDYNERRKKVTRGYRRLRKFSWTRSAIRYLNTIRQSSEKGIN